jgi:hypothetical protein
MDDDFRDGMLKIRAKPDSIAQELSDVLRSLMRAVAADDPSSGTTAAAKRMEYIDRLLEHCDEPLNWHWLFAEAVRNLQSALPDDPHDKRYVTAAQRGMKYLAESSADDPAARGRASQRLSEFLQAIEWSRAARRSD